MSLPPSSAPTATGWNDSCRAGFAPAEEWRLSTAHAICNLYECFGDVVASVDIEHNEFVTITLKNSAHDAADGKILVGPRGTFAYMLMRGEERLPGHGSTSDRIFFFPDNEARAAFEEFGWIPLEEQQSSLEPPS